MHEGFVNYNAGTLGASMVEGRISAGVVVGDGTDVGGGASIMGTLSGGGTEVISIGERCLLGANAGIGISLGDDCVVEAGCYVTAGTKVTVKDIDRKPKVVKAATLSGADNVLFRRNSVTAPSRRCRGRARAWPSTRTCMRTRSSDRRTLRRRRRRSVVVVGVGHVVARRRTAPRPRGLHGRGRRRTGDLIPEQARNASVIAADRRAPRAPGAGGVDRARDGVPGVQIRNLDHGDRDSLGIFQQRPSQGWGTRARCGPVLRDQRVLRRAREDRRLPDDADHRGRPEGAALRLPRGLRGARRGRTGAGFGADRLQPGGRVQLHRATAGDGNGHRARPPRTLAEGVRRRSTIARTGARQDFTVVPSPATRRPRVDAARLGGRAVPRRHTPADCRGHPDASTASGGAVGSDSEPDGWTSAKTESGARGRRRWA